LDNSFFSKICPIFWCQFTPSLTHTLHPTAPSKTGLLQVPRQSAPLVPSGPNACGAFRIPRAISTPAHGLQHLKKSNFFRHKFTNQI
ncbi:MAG: hypothetical protein MJZ50_10635, partial [Treponema sp.]|nr:hypothetical protein [Treponema sp.]